MSKFIAAPFHCISWHNKGWIRSYLFIGTICFLLLNSGWLYAQNARTEISGQVISVENEPLPAIVVLIKGTTHGTQTDIDGNFSIPTSASDTLEISGIGFESKLVVITDPEEKLVIQLSPVINSFDDVVIIGYGTQRKSDVIGAITKIDLQGDVTKIPVGSFDAQLQGKAAGVQIATNSGIPGSDVFIRVRGTTSVNSSNDPLYIIDGVFVNSSSLQGLAQDRATSPLADINPADIESIEILKDASAIGIYGSRGANGVILVTTKRGNYGQKPRINVHTSQGVATVPKERAWKLTTGPEHAMLVEEFRANEGLDPVFTAGGPRGLPEEQQTYDRMEHLYHNGRLQNYDVSIDGGSQSTRYYIAAGYTSQEAIWRPIDFRRTSFKVNIDQKISDKITIGTSNTLSRSNRNGARPANGGLGTLLQASLSIPTYLPIFDDNGVPLRWSSFDNIYELTTNVNQWSTSNHYIGSLYGEWDIVPNLKFRSSISLDYNVYEENEYWGTNVLLGAPPTNGRASQSLTQANAWINEQTLRYTKTVAGKHNFGILVGNHIQSNTFTNAIAQGTGFPNNSFTLVTAAANQTATQRWSKNTMLSFFSRVEYDFQKKYLIEAVIRADGSSKFDPAHRWGYFPAIGGAWRISEEDFLKDNRVINNLKLRINYGQSGNQNGINDFASRGLWGAGAAYPDEGTTQLPGILPLQLPNPSLTWEKTTQFNVGLDVELIRNRIGLEINYYNKYTTDALLEVAVPSTTGFTSYLTNFGEISNKGFEFTLNTININKKNFQWTTSFNVAQNINTVEKIPNSIPFASRDLIRLEEGYPLYSYWLYHQLGVDPQTGDAIFEDVNGDGQITPDDRKIVGSTWPKFFGGLTNNFSLGAFDLNLFLVFSYGNSVWNHNRMLGENGGTTDANRAIFASNLDRWQQPGDITNTPRLTRPNYARLENSRFFEDGSFLRIRSLSLGYTLPKRVSEKVKIERLRIYALATNLWLFTKYTGADPETNLQPGGQQNIQGYDFATPQQPRTVQFGINVTL